MLRHYLTIALRSLMRDKAYSLINILGLSVGLACCILMFLFVRHEWTYDAFHTNASSIYRIIIEKTEYSGKVTPWGSTSRPLAATIEEQFPDVEQAVRMRYWGGIVQYGDQTFQEDNVWQTEPSFFEMFTFPLHRGNATTALSDKQSVVLSRQAADKYFPDSDPMGRRIMIRETEFAITGITEQLPGNSSVMFDFLIPFQEPLTNWRRGGVYSFIQLRDPSRIPELEHAIQTLIDEYAPAVGVFTAQKAVLQPLTDIHLTPGILFDFTDAADPRMPYILAGIALMVLFIACINFMNLSLGRSATRIKEIGVRKVMGAQRMQLIRQFWGETVILTALALFLGLNLAHLFLPIFNSLAEVELHLDYLSDGTTILALVGLLAVVSLVAGSYPAFVLSGFSPTAMFRNRHLGLGGTGLFSRGLVVLQFGLSILLVIATFVMFDQLSYLRQKNLGFDQEQVIVIRPGDNQLVDRFRNAVESHPNILYISGTAPSIGPDRGMGMAGFTGPDGKSISVYQYIVDYDYLKTMGMELNEGRTFSREFGADPNTSVVVNKTLVREMGWEDPIGQSIPNSNYTVIGVVEDYNFRSLHYPVEPVMLWMDPSWIKWVLLKIKPEDVAGTLSLLERTWNEVVPDLPFEYYFLDDEVDRFYRTEQRFSVIATYASLFAIGIACLGIFGLTTLTVARRIREIGIRKIMGAGIKHILQLISREYLLLVIIANVLAWPAAYFAAQHWLAEFSYRIDLSVTPFIISALMVLTVALATVAFHAVRAARTNPVDTLRE